MQTRTRPLSTAAAARTAAARRRAPLMALALVALLAGLWGGLLRLGLSLPSAVTTAGAVHGPLMALGFLGTLVSLERAVALGRWWAYLAPAAAGAGALAALADPAGSLGPALLVLAGVVLVAAHAVLQRVQPSSHNLVMGLGALAWCAAAGLWLAGCAVPRFAPLMAGLLVLTIVGERLELTRVMQRPPIAARLLLGAIALFALGLAAAVAGAPGAVRVAGAGLLAQAAWLARYDVARRTVRMGGVTRFMALALLAGYVWLAIAGGLWLLHGLDPASSSYDASLHAVFLGFVMSMVFAHAPVIVPAVLRVRLPFSRRFYAHLVLLHASLALRLLGGDLAHGFVAWQWGGILGEVAILLFLLATVTAVARRPAARTG